MTPAPGAQIEVRLQLSRTTVTAGTEIPGVLIVENHGPEPLKTECGFLFAAGLSNSDHSFSPAFTLACRMNQSVPAGISRYPVTVITTYQSCSQSGQADGTTPGCLPGPMGAGSRFTVAPPLPKGVYRTEIVANGLPDGAVHTAEPIAVTLT